MADISPFIKTKKFESTKEEKEGKKMGGGDKKEWKTKPTEP